jgi:hypothetical protein
MFPLQPDLKWLRMRAQMDARSLLALVYRPDEVLLLLLIWLLVGAASNCAPNRPNTHQLPETSRLKAFFIIPPAPAPLPLLAAPPAAAFGTVR